jgi:hypothetical protein
MAGILITVTMTDGSTMAVNASISDTDVARLLAAMAVKYRKPENEDSPWLIRKWYEDCIVDALNYTKRYEEQQAAEAAASAVQMIPVTIS